MAIVKGSLVLVEYVARAKDTSELFETTRRKEHASESTAPGTGADAEDTPKLVVVGEGWVLDGLDEALIGMAPGEKKTVEIPPEKALGVRNPRKVRMIPLRKLGEDAEKVSVGDVVTIGREKGTIRHIGSGRVQIDYNHPFAGKTIIYEIEIKKLLESDAEKSDAISRDGFSDYGGAKIRPTLLGDSLEISVPEEMFRVEGLQTAKHLVKRNIFRFVKQVKKIRFVEEHLAEPPKPVIDKEEFIRSAGPDAVEPGSTSTTDGKNSHLEGTINA